MTIDNGYWDDCPTNTSISDISMSTGGWTDATDTGSLPPFVPTFNGSKPRVQIDRVYDVNRDMYLYSVSYGGTGGFFISIQEALLFIGDQFSWGEHDHLTL